MGLSLLKLIGKKIVFPFIHIYVSDYVLDYFSNIFPMQLWDLIFYASVEFVSTLSTSRYVSSFVHLLLFLQYKRAIE